MDATIALQRVRQAGFLLNEARAELRRLYDDPGEVRAEILRLDVKIQRATRVLEDARSALDRTSSSYMSVPGSVIVIRRPFRRVRRIGSNGGYGVADEAGAAAPPTDAGQSV